MARRQTNSVTVLCRLCTTRRHGHSIQSRTAQPEQGEHHNAEVDTQAASAKPPHQSCLVSHGKLPEDIVSRVCHVVQNNTSEEQRGGTILLSFCGVSLHHAIQCVTQENFEIDCLFDLSQLAWAGVPICLWAAWSTRLHWTDSRRNVAPPLMRPSLC
jgi:hypothetical protein